MTEETIGTFKEISEDFCDTVKEIMKQGKDAEIRRRKDGSYDVFELDRKKHRPAKRSEETE